MKKLFAAFATLFMLSGCVTNPIPKDYKGPLAYIEDSTSSSKTPGLDFFVVDAVNGNVIAESIGETLSANYGQGFNMSPVVIGRNIPARESTFTLLGRTHYAAPVLALTNTVYSIKGDVTFTPEPNKKYLVKGELSENYSAVWLEETSTGEVVGNKIETRGAGSLGFFEK